MNDTVILLTRMLELAKQNKICVTNYRKTENAYFNTMNYLAQLDRVDSFLSGPVECDLDFTFRVKKHVFDLELKDI